MALGDTLPSPCDRRLLLRIASVVLRPIQQLWWALPFRLRLLLRGGQLPPPPQVHASPRVAAMLTGSVIDSSKSRRRALSRGGFDRKGEQGDDTQEHIDCGQNAFASGHRLLPFPGPMHLGQHVLMAFCHPVPADSVS